MSLTKMKAETESRMSEQKRNADRKRNIVILIEKYLLTIGCIDTVTKLQQETNITLEKWNTADNIDLFMIFLDYEQYYENRFGKAPKVVKKVDDMSNYQQLKKAALKQKQINSSINKNPQGSQPPHKRTQQFIKQTSKKEIQILKKVKKDKKVKKILKEKPKLSRFKEIHQQSGKDKKKEDDDDNRYDARVLKGMPDYQGVPQYKELAAYLQRDILVQNPNIKFDDIIGLGNAKSLIMEAVTFPIKYPHFFIGITEPWRGILLYGPPGTGKTLLAKAVATQCKTTFFNISASSVVSKWRGQSQKLIRILFELAKFYQPSTIFIDEIDSIMSQRSSSGSEHQGSRRMKTQLLIQMQGLVKKGQNVFVLAASNIPWDLDDAMLRRLEKRILVQLPSLEAREDMVKRFLEDRIGTQIQYLDIAKRLEGYSGSDIRLVCKEAAMKPVRKLLFQLEGIEVTEQNVKVNKNKARSKEQCITPDPVTMKDIEEALSTVKKSPGLIMKKYVQWNQQFGSA